MSDSEAVVQIEGTPSNCELGIPSLNPEKYQKLMDEMPLSEAEKLELLQTLWNIMTAFVDLGFGVDSVQQVLPALNEIASELDADELEKVIGNHDQRQEDRCHLLPRIQHRSNEAR